MEFPTLQLVTLTLVLSLDTSEKSLSIFFCPLPGQVSVHIDLNWGWEFQLSQPLLLQKMHQSRKYLHGHLPHFSRSSISFLHCGVNKRCSTLELPSLVLSWKRGSPSFDLLSLLNAAEGTIVLLCHKIPLLAHVQLGVHQHTQVLFWKAPLQMVGLHPCTARGCSSSGAALSTSPCWISGGSC